MSVPLFDTADPARAPARRSRRQARRGARRRPLHPRPGGRGASSSEFAAYLGARHAIGVANGTDALTHRAAGARRRARRRGRRAVVHVLRVGRGDPADRRAARVLRRRPETFCVTPETVQAAHHAAHEGGDRRAPVRQRRAGRGDRGARRAGGRGRRAGGRRARGRRAPRRLARHDRDLLVLPLQEPRRLRRRRRRRDERRRARRARADAALPRLARQGDASSSWATTRASTRCRPRCCASRCRTSTRWCDGRRAAAAAYDDVGPGRGRARCRSRPRAARPRGTSTSCATREPDALAAALKAADIGHKAYYRVPTHRQPAMREYAAGGPSCPSTDELARTHLAIPMSPVLDAEQVAEVARAAHAVAAHRMR